MFHSRRRFSFSRSVLRCLALCCSLLSPGLVSSAELPSGAEVLERLRLHNRGIKNVHSVTLWERSENGKLMEWTKATVDSDDMQRIRYFEERGVYDARGNRVAETKECHIYNGEITADFDYNYDPLKGVRQLDGEDTHVDIFGGPAPGKNGPFALLNPVGFSTNGVVIHLESSLGEKSEVSVSRIPSKQKDDQLLELKYQIGPNKFRTVVDWKRGVAVSSQLRNKQGKLVWESEAAEYTEDLPGIYTPLTGVDKRPTEIVSTFPGKDGLGRVSKIRPFEIRFRRLELEFNNQSFDEDLFNIVLSPGTYVYDQRYKIDYRVGD